MEKKTRNCGPCRETRRVRCVSREHSRRQGWLPGKVEPKVNLLEPTWAEANDEGDELWGARIRHMPVEKRSKYFSRCSFLTQLVFTVVGWAVLSIFVGWVLTAVGWYLLAVLWRRELFVPSSVASTAYSVALVLLWAAIIFLLQSAWAKFNFARYFQRNRRRVDPLADHVPPPLSWAEITVSPSHSGANAEATTASKPGIDVRWIAITPANSSPTRLLSEAASLSMRGDYVRAMSLLRLVIGHPEAPFFARQVAACRLSRLLSITGHNRLAQRLAIHFCLKGDEGNDA